MILVAVAEHERVKRPRPSTLGKKPGGGPSPRSSMMRLPAVSMTKQAGPLALTPDISRSVSGLLLTAFCFPV
jgi:hypothetical protein